MLAPDSRYFGGFVGFGGLGGFVGFGSGVGLGTLPAVGSVGLGVGWAVGVGVRAGVGVGVGWAVGAGATVGVGAGDGVGLAVGRCVGRGDDRVGSRRGVGPSGAEGACATSVTEGGALVDPGVAGTGSSIRASGVSAGSSWTAMAGPYPDSVETGTSVSRNIARTMATAKPTPIPTNV